MKNLVLILVLMEDALALKDEFDVDPDDYGLNPCFNGRCTRTEGKQNICISAVGLNPCFNGRCTRTCKGLKPRENLACLNPCFNGRCTRTLMSFINLFTKYTVLILVLMEDALARLFDHTTKITQTKVLILVLMEDALALCIFSQIHERIINVLILVLMEDALAPM